MNGMPNFAAAGQDPEQQRLMQEYFMRVNEMDPQKKAFSRQRALAEQLRAGAVQPGMRRMASGSTDSEGKRGVGVVQAAHPLEFLSSLAHAGGAAYQGYKADKGEDAYRAGRRRNFADLANPKPQAAHGGFDANHFEANY